MPLTNPRVRRGRHGRRLWSLLLLMALVVPAAAHSEERDRTEPRPPEDLELAAASATSLSLSWDRAHPRRGGSYELFLNDAPVATTDELQYTFNGLRCGTSYTLGVETVDDSENASDRVSVVAATSACADTPSTPPPAEPSPQPPPPRTPAAQLPRPQPATPALAANTSGEPDTPVPDGAVNEPPIDDTPPKTTLPMSWKAAGAFVWHETALDPVLLGHELRQNGFGWIAIQVHDGTTVEPLDRDWVRRFRAASGLPVGGWGVLRTEPEREAELAHGLVGAYQLDFYIADAESEYKLTGDDGQSAERYGRSERFIRAFRSLSPDLPAAVSSYCRADRADIDWRAWNEAGFSFLPQAYANDLGSTAGPTACMAGATGFFSTENVHPTIGMYRGQDGRLSADQYATALAAANVVGFSVYLADNVMSATDWSSLGDAIRALGIAESDPGKSNPPPSVQRWSGGPN